MVRFPVSVAGDIWHFGKGIFFPERRQWFFIKEPTPKFAVLSGRCWPFFQTQQLV
jgi:hypothetical protein